MRHSAPSLGGLVLAATGVMMSAVIARAQVTLPSVIGSHMVLQRNMPVPVWGAAAPGEKITVRFRTQEKSATADAQGKWMVKLDPLEAGGPDPMRITGTRTITLEDVLVGEVWLGSGQSNMQLDVREAAHRDPALSAAAARSYPKIRLIETDWNGWKAGVRNWRELAEESPPPPGAGWRAATRENISSFSALLFAYGLVLHDELDVPVGLIVGAVGATPSICWLSREACEGSEACRAAVADHTATVWPGELHKQQTRWQETVAAAREAGRPSPGAFHPWRKSIPGSFSGNWKTGVPHAHYENRIRPVIPFAIRGVLWDQGENGTAITGLDQYTLMGALIRGWREDWGQGDFPFIYVQKPSGPGCAWDRADPVTRCAREFSPLPETVPDTEDGLYIENHIRIRRYPNTAMVTSSDLGPNNHPDSKSGYGARAARVALGLTYGRKVEIYGPVYASHQIEADKVRIRFTHVGQGLVCRHAGKLQGFSVAGEDRVFKWADAVIDGDSVIVTSSSVKAPVAVRYGWGRTYPWANLFNGDRLPALPFRTDTWEQPRAEGVGSTRR